eukprot:RCo039857
MEEAASSAPPALAGASPVYAELLKGQSGVIQETRAHILRMMVELEQKKELCHAERVLLSTFKKDITDAFTDCRNRVKETFAAIMEDLKNRQEEMLRQVEDSAQHNLEVLRQRAQQVERVEGKLDLQIEEGQNLLRETDNFTVFARGALYRQLPPVPVQPVQLQFKDDFPDLTSLSIARFLAPMHHAVQVDLKRFLSSGETCAICGNIFYAGFRFQIQLKHDGRNLSAYLCLRAWHDISPFLRLTIGFTLALHADGVVLHTATAKNTFQGPNDGWGWNKFIALNKIPDCSEALFEVNFNELSYEFVTGESRRAGSEPPGAVAYPPLQELSLQ